MWLLLQRNVCITIMGNQKLLDHKWSMNHMLFIHNLHITGTILITQEYIHLFTHVKVRIIYMHESLPRAFIWISTVSYLKYQAPPAP